MDFRKAYNLLTDEHHVQFWKTLESIGRQEKQRDGNWIKLKVKFIVGL